MISPLLIVKRVAQGNDVVAMVAASFDVSQSDHEPPQSRIQRSIRFHHSQADSDIEQEMQGYDNESKRIFYDLVSQYLTTHAAPIVNAKKPLGHTQY